MTKPRRRLAPELKTKLLGLIKLGNDLEAACGALDLSPKVVQQDAALMAQVSEQYRAATGRLRSKLLEVALKGDDARVLGQLLADREEAQQRMAPARLRVDLDGLRAELLAEIDRHAQAQQVVAGRLCEVLKGLLNGEVLKWLSFEAIGAIECALAMLGDPEHATRYVLQAQIVERIVTRYAPRPEPKPAVADSRTPAENRHLEELPVLDETEALPASRAPAVQRWPAPGDADFNGGGPAGWSDSRWI